MLPLVNVHVFVKSPDGQAMSGVQVSMRLLHGERFNGVVMPREICETTNSDGEAVLCVFPNELGTEGSEYEVSIGSGREMVKGRAVVPNRDCMLSDILSFPPYERRSPGSAISDEAMSIALGIAKAATDAKAILNKAIEAQSKVEKAVSGLEGYEERLRGIASIAQSKVEKAVSGLEGYEERACEAQIQAVRAAHKVEEAAQYIASIKEMQIAINEIQSSLSKLMNA